MPPVQGPNQIINSDPYAFLNENQRRSGGLINSFKGKSLRRQVLTIVGGGLVLVILLLGLKSILASNNGLDMPSIYSVLGQQRELMNLSTTGGQQASSSQTYLNFSTTTLASITNDHTKLLKLMRVNGIKISISSYVLQPSADTQLNQAIQVSNFDPIYATVMQTELKLYQSDLTNAFNLNTSAILKSYLKTDYQNATLLIKMLGASYG